jgi:hypothetical protein
MGKAEVEKFCAGYMATLDPQLLQQLKQYDKPLAPQGAVEKIAVLQRQQCWNAVACACAETVLSGGEVIYIPAAFANGVAEIEITLPA